MAAPSFSTRNPDGVRGWATSSGSADVTRAGGRVVLLGDDDVAELLAARDAVRRASLPLLGVGREDFPLPRSGERLADLAEGLDDAHGVVVVRGIPADRLTVADLRLVLWGVGRHLGVPVSQDATGRLIRTADTDRGDFHSGGSDVTALLVRDERTIGVTAAGRVVDEVVRCRPDLAVRLFDSFHHDRMGEQDPGERPSRSTPLACVHEGRLSLRYDRRAIESAQRLAGVPRLSPADLELLDLLDATAEAPEGREDLHLRVGDLVLVDNYTVLHRHTPSSGPAATAPLRLWLTLRRGRPLPAGFTWPTPAYGESGGRGGVAPRDVVDPVHRLARAHALG